MYSEKSVGRKMEHWRTPALNGPSHEDFPSRTTLSSLLLRKDEIRPNIWPGIPRNLLLWRRPVCQTLSKALDISSVTAQVVPDLLKALLILSDTIVRRSAVHRENLKPYWKSERRPHFSKWPTSLLFKSFSKILLTTERRLTGWQFLVVLLSPIFLNIKITSETFEQSEKQDSFIHILNSSGTMYESSGSQFFRITTGTQSGPDAFDKSKWLATLG